MTHFAILPRLTLAASLLAALPAHATVEAGHWGLGVSADGTSANLRIDQTPDGDWTGSVLKVSGRTLQGVTYTLDGGASFYVVSQGQLLTQAVLESAAVKPLAGVPFGLNGPSVTVGQDFWVGARIRETAVGEGPWTGLGWAHMRFDAQGKLTLLDSAVGFHEASLVVGQIPEPSTAALGLLGLGGIAFAARRQRASA